MPFDILSARKDGYTDDEIRSYLSTDFDVDGAMADGYSLDEISSFLTTKKPLAVQTEMPLTPTHEPEAPLAIPETAPLAESPYMPEIEPASSSTVAVEPTEPMEAIPRITTDPESAQQVAEELFTSEADRYPEVEPKPGIQPIRTAVEGVKRQFRSLGEMIKGIGTADQQAAERRIEDSKKNVEDFRAKGMEQQAQIWEDVVKKHEKDKETFKKIEESGKEISDFYKPSEKWKKAEGVKGFAQDVIMGLTQMPTTAAVTVAGTPAAGAAWMATQIAGGKYEQLIQEGVEPERALTAGIIDALMQAPLEQIGVGKVMKVWKPGKVASKAIKEIAEAGATEFITEGLQTYPEAVTDIWAKTEGENNAARVDQLVADFWEITKDAAYQASVGGVVGLAAGAPGAITTGRPTPPKPEAPEAVEERIEEVKEKMLEEGGMITEKMQREKRVPKPPDTKVIPVAEKEEIEVETKEVAIEKETKKGIEISKPVKPKKAEGKVAVTEKPEPTVEKPVTPKVRKKAEAVEEKKVEEIPPEKVVEEPIAADKLKSGAENVETNFGIAGNEDTFEIIHKDGAKVTGYYKNQDFPGEKIKKDRGEVFYTEVPEGGRKKGVGYNLTEDAIRTIDANGGKTVNLSITTDGGKALVDKLVKNGVISEAIKTSKSGKSEHNILLEKKLPPPEKVEEKPVKDLTYEELRKEGKRLNAYMPRDTRGNLKIREKDLRHSVEVLRADEKDIQDIRKKVAKTYKKRGISEKEAPVHFDKAEIKARENPPKNKPDRDIRDIVVKSRKEGDTKNQILTEANAKEDEAFLNKWEKAYQVAKDATVSIRKVQKIFEKETGEKATPEDNIEYKIDRVRGAGGTAKQFVSDNLMPVFDNIRKGRKAAEVGKITRNLEEYLIAKRQQWLYENKEKYDDVGYTKEWADEKVEKYESGKLPNSDLIQESAKQVWEYSKKLKDIKKAYGVIDEEFDKMLKEPYYAPFYRDVEKKTVPGIRGEKFTAMSKGIKRIKGSKSGRNIRNVFSNLITNTNETIVNATRNDVFNSIIDYAGKSEEVGELIKKMPARWVKAGTIEHRTAVDAVLTPELDKIIKELGGTQKVKTKTGKKLGTYQPKNKEVMMMFGATETTKAHELGHLIDDDVIPLQGMVKKFPKEMVAAASLRYEGSETTQSYINYVHQNDEVVAEFVSMYITDRPTLAKIAPNALTYFEGLIQKNKTLKKLVDMAPSRQREIEKFTEDNWIMDTSIPRDDDVISGFVEGKMQHYRVPMELATAVKNLHPEQIPVALRILTIPTSILRRGAVSYNIDFFIPNSVRDQIGAAFNAKFYPVFDYLAGLKHFIAQDEIFKQYMREGGAMDSPESGIEQLQTSAKELIYGSKRGQYFDPNYWRETGLMRKTKDLTGYFVKAPFRGIAKLGEISEQATRLGVFERGLKSGQHVREAVHSGRQASLDFQRFGTHGRVPNQIIPFVNAALEGVDRTARSAYERPASFALAAFVYGIAPTIALTIWNEDDDEYKNVSDREKENNYIIMKKDGTGEYWKIPKSHVVKLIVNPFQMAWERSLGTSDGKWGDIASTVWSSASPVDNLGTIVPTGLKLLIEPIANYDFYWKKVIEAPYIKAVGEPGARYNKSTSESLKKIGKVLNISPIMMQHEINSLFSGMGRHELFAVDWALGKTGVLPETEVTENRVPILRRFKGKAEVWKGEISQDIREIDKTTSRIDKMSIKSLMKYNKYTGVEAAKAYSENKKMKMKLLRKKYELSVALGVANELLKEIEKEYKNAQKQEKEAVEKTKKAIKDISEGK